MLTNEVTTAPISSAEGDPASRFEIGKSTLRGTVRVSGAKNSVLRLLAASLLTAERIELTNYPASLLDAQVHVEMLRALGKECRVAGNVLDILQPGPISSHLDWDGRSIRNTLLILGALVARTGEGSVPLPGGCDLGDRKIDLHELVLRSLGTKVWVENGRLHASAPNGLTGAEIHLPLRSTGATENAIMTASLARGVTRLWNPHIRPEILDLVDFLNSMGATIRVFGQEHIEITGVDVLNGTNHAVMPDNMEAVTWLIAATITGGEIEIQNFPKSHLEVPLIHLRESGVRMFEGDDSVIVKGGKCYPVEISTGPYPGINSDMQPLFALFGAAATGESRIVDLRFPGRYGYAGEFGKMGVETEVIGNLLAIRGTGRMQAATVTALDLRAGVALALAGLIADGGTTVVEDAWQVQRGYDNFEQKLTSLEGRIAVRG